MDIKLSMYNLNDEITYKMTLRNNTNNDINIASINDNNDSEYINTNYELSNNILKTNETVDLLLTIKYSKLIEEKEYLLDQQLVIQINYEDGKSSNINININENPQTSDSIFKFVSLFFINILLLLVCIYKKNRLNIMLIILSFPILIPTSVSAITTKISITIKSKINLYNIKEAYFKPGKEVDIQMHNLSGLYDLDWQYIEDIGLYQSGIINNEGYISNIKNIIRVNNDEYENIKDNLDDSNIVSEDDSDYPIYMWYEDNNIYWYSEANVVYMNEDASYMFNDLNSLESIDLTLIDTSLVTNMNGLFQNCSHLSTVDMSNFDTSNVINMSSMFRNFGSEVNELEFDLNSFDTSNVTDMSWMFASFGRKKQSFKLDVSNFDTSNVESMKGMFASAGEFSQLFDLDVSGFDTSKVTNMFSMFSRCGTSASSFYLNISNFNTLNVSTMSEMFTSTGSNAITWNVIIPKTNGGSILNTIERMYGRSTSVYINSKNAKTGRKFTLSD